MGFVDTPGSKIAGYDTLDDLSNINRKNDRDHFGRIYT